MGDTQHEHDGYCRSADYCRAFNNTARKPAETAHPLCDTCLTVAERDTRALLWDYLDLAQLHAASLSQAINEKTGGSKDSPMLIAGHVEALQAEIVHVLTAWETEVRARARLSEAPTQARGGAHVQRAIGVLSPRMRLLSRIEPTAVCRTGAEDDPEDVAGWEAVHHLQALHNRARSYLGRTRRITQLPGDCPGREDRPCDGELYRGEPRFVEDPCDVYCGTCHNTWPYEDYQRYVGMMLALPQPEAAA